MRVNERRPQNPIPRQGWPENRVWQIRGGQMAKCGSVIPVGAGDSWETLAQSCDGIPAEEIAFANFDTYDPWEINWYLREYVGCRKPGPRGFNYTFDGAKPGKVFLPFPDQLIAHVVERGQRAEERRRREIILQKRWDGRKVDIAEGLRLVEAMREDVYLTVQKHVPNEHDFDVQKELAGEVVDRTIGAIKEGKKPTFPSATAWHWELMKATLMPLKELHPEQDEVRLKRMSYYNAFAAGLAHGLYPEGGQPWPRHEKSAGERAFFDKGRIHAARLSKKQRYQMVMGLIERERTWGLQGANPIPQQRRNFEARMTRTTIERQLRKEFQNNRMWFRNNLDKNFVDHSWDTLKEKAKDPKTYMP